MINPVKHGGSAEAIATYKVEPYVVAADVYAAPGRVGRGGREVWLRASYNPIFDLEGRPVAFGGRSF